MQATKANAARWFNARIGEEILTKQVRPDGMVWEPGPRTLMRAKTHNHWKLDDSSVRITTNHEVLSVTGEAVTLEWLDDDGVTINVTRYSLAE